MVKTKTRFIVCLIVSLAISNAIAAPPYPGYIFCASGYYGYLISPTGETVNTWKASGSACSNAYLRPDGSALFPINTTFTAGVYNIEVLHSTGSFRASFVTM
jgi:hypothetical protein